MSSCIFSSVFYQGVSLVISSVTISLSFACQQCIYILFIEIIIAFPICIILLPHQLRIIPLGTNHLLLNVKLSVFDGILFNSSEIALLATNVLINKVSGLGLAQILTTFKFTNPLLNVWDSELTWHVKALAPKPDGFSSVTQTHMTIGDNHHQQVIL